MKIDISKFRKVPFERRLNCVICEKKVGNSIIKLPNFPMTEIYLERKPKEKLGFVDQEFYFCKNCGHGQILNVIDVDLQYGNSLFYYFRTSESASGRESADFFIDFLNEVIKNKHLKTIIEVGCNDLYILKKIRNKASKLIGIDPILKGKEKECSQRNIVAIGDFLENINIDDDIDLVICKDTLEHVSEPKEFIKKIIDRAHKDTLFFFQFPFLETILSGCRFDHIFHQHLNYFSLRSIIFMLKELGCELMNYKINFNHWGSIMIAFRKKKKASCHSGKVIKITQAMILEKYNMFKDNMRVISQRLKCLKDEKIYGYGAALMLPVLGYHLNTDFSFLEALMDDDIKKDGKYYVNLPIRIYYSGKIKKDVLNNATVLITALDSAKPIITKLLSGRVKNIIYPFHVI